MKKTISYLLAAVLILSLCVSAFAAPATIAAVKPVEDTPIDDQLKLIAANMPALSKDDPANKVTWQYTVTDLDHNGRLELIAATTENKNFYTYAVMYEVNADLNSFTICDLGINEGDPFVDIIAASADTYYYQPADTWYYMFTEGYADNADKYYAVKCSVSLKDSYATANAYAKQTTETVNGVGVTTYLDLEDKIITPDEFNDIGNKNFAKCEKSSTNFDWFKLDEVKNATRLTASYEVFAGLRKAEKKAPIISEPTPTPVSKYLRVTKDPTSEYSLTEGDTCWFVAYGENATSMTWTFVSPNGGEYSAANFEKQFRYCSVSGQNSSNLRIDNVSTDMSYWGAYCTFYNSNGQTVRSSTATMKVSVKPTPVPRPTENPYVTRSTYGYVTSWSLNHVTFYLPEYGTSVVIDKSLCTFLGIIEEGCDADVCFEGNYPTDYNVFMVTIHGNTDPIYPEDPEIDPVYPEWNDDYEDDYEEYLEPEFEEGA